MIKHQHPQGKRCLSGKLFSRMKRAEWMGRKLRDFCRWQKRMNMTNTRPDQKSMASFKKHSALPRAKPHLHRREQGTNPDVHVTPNYVLRVLPNTQTACHCDCDCTFGMWAVNTLVHLKRLMKMSLMISIWKPFFYKTLHRKVSF